MYEGCSHGSVIDIGFSLVWTNPVYINQGGLCDRAITGPRDALRYLQQDIDKRSGQLYWNAISSCGAALRYRFDLELSRRDFMAACGGFETATF